LRNGTILKTPPTFLRVVGYLLLSLAAILFWTFRSLPSFIVFSAVVTLVLVSLIQNSLAKLGLSRWNPRLCHFHPNKLGKNVPHNFPVHIGQAEVAAAVSIRQPFMIDSHEMQNRRVQIVDVNLFCTACQPKSSVAP